MVFTSTRETSMVDFDDFDIGPQSDEPEYDDAPYDSDSIYGDAEMAQYDDDPSPYDGTYSEE